MSKTAKLFWSGRSQAVRLPKEFRMTGDEVRIRKQGAAVILECVFHGFRSRIPREGGHPVHVIPVT